MRLMSLCLFLAVVVGVFQSRAGEPSRRAKVELPKRGLCAHRGAMNTHPENTLSAFREAIRCGAHMIEFDVRLTKDKRLVVIHDSTVDRTTNGKGEVSDLAFGEIRRLDAGSWKSPKFRGEKVPTLQETLSMMPINIWLNVHLKGGAEPGRRTAELIAAEDRLHQAFIACSASAAEAAKTAVPGILICNMDRQGNSWNYVKNTVVMEADFIQLAGGISPQFREYSGVLTKHGIRVNYFGTDSPQELRALFELGVQFPLVNRIADSMKVAADLGIEPAEPVFRGQDRGNLNTRPAGP